MQTIFSAINMKGVSTVKKVLMVWIRLSSGMLNGFAIEVILTMYIPKNINMLSFIFYFNIYNQSLFIII